MLVVAEASDVPRVARLDQRALKRTALDGSGSETSLSASKNDCRLCETHLQGCRALDIELLHLGRELGRFRPEQATATRLDVARKS